MVTCISWRRSRRALWRGSSTRGALTLPAPMRALFLVGLATGAASCASAPHNPVLDGYPAGVEGRTSVSYYDISGRTYAELHADMRRLGPKNYGGSFVGETRSP